MKTPPKAAHPSAEPAEGFGSLASSGFVDASSFWVPEYICESAWLAHAPFLFWLIGQQRPSYLVELGAHSGFSYFAACQAVRDHGTATRCFAIDTWLGDEQSGFYGEDVFREFSRYHERTYSAFSSIIRGTFEESVLYFEDGSIDLLHIDGSHEYEDVRRDFETWLPKMSTRGLVLLHDTNVRERDFGVSRFLGELKGRYPTLEFIHGHGLGVIRVGEATDDVIDRLVGLDHDSEVALALRTTYARLGEIVEHACWRGVAERALAERSAVAERALAEQSAVVERLNASLAELQSDVARLNASLAEQLVLLDQARSSLAQASLTPYLGLRHTVRHPGTALSALRTFARAWRNRRLVSKSPLLDLDWYTKHFPDAARDGLDPAMHYLTAGAPAGYDPGPAFSTVGYLVHHPDVASTGINPLAHYLRWGALEGRLVPPSRLASDADSPAGTQE